MTAGHPPETVPEAMQAWGFELSLLGSAMRDASAVELSRVQVADIYDPRHRTIWAAMMALRGRQAPIDCATLEEELLRSGKLDAVGGAEYVADIAEAAATGLQAAHYGEQVRAAATARRARRLLADSVRALDDAWACEGREGMETCAAGLANDLLRVAVPAEGRSDSVTHRQAVRQVVDEVQAAYNARISGTVAAGSPWCFPCRPPDSSAPTLDDNLRPMVGGELYVYAARTGSGKTVAGWQTAYDSAVTTGRISDVFTGEVRAAGLALRSAARHARIDGAKLGLGDLTDGDISQLLHYAGRADVPVVIWDSPRQTIEWIGAMLRVIEATRPEAQRGGLVVIDYYQRVKSDVADKRRLSATERLEHIAEESKILAGVLNRPVLMLAQLRRDLPWGDASREDIGGSKRLADEATAVVMLSNGSTDHPAAPPGYAEVQVAKNRTGMSGQTVVARFNGPHQQFEATHDHRWTPAKEGKR